jgi:4-amino-4-deoxy-L-arabinose transferase-like glycosyltransferase
MKVQLALPQLVLGIIILIFLALGTVIAIKVPAYESSDEPDHVQNIETLASGHWYSLTPHCRLTLRTIYACTNGDEAQQAPLYYLLFAGWQRLVGQSVQAPFNQAIALPVRAHAERYAKHGAAAHRFLLWLRLPNVLLGALTVLLAYFAVRLVTADVWTPVIAASLVACLPRFVFLSSFVTNDNLVNVLGALFVFLAVRYALSPSRWRMVTVGVVFGLLVLTKLSALPIAITIVVLALMVKGRGKRLEFAVVGFGSALVICGWYLIQNTVRYGQPLAQTDSSRYLAIAGGLGTTFGPYHVSDPVNLVVVQVPRRIVDSFWYQSGWDQFHWSTPVNLVITAGFAAALLGLIHRRVSLRVTTTFWTIALSALLCVWVLAFQTATYQARYAYVGLTAICGLAALGLERWRLPVRFILPAAGLVGTLLAIHNDVLGVRWT